MGLVKLFGRIHLTLALDGTVPAGFAGMPTFKKPPLPDRFYESFTRFSGPTSRDRCFRRRLLTPLSRFGTLVLRGASHRISVRAAAPTDRRGPPVSKEW
jgi:hypothetical protein